MTQTLQLSSTLECPVCHGRQEEVMPTEACAFFHQCRHCRTVLRPRPGDCCVFCSYGTVPCPPVQRGDCCRASGRPSDEAAQPSSHTPPGEP